MTAGMPSSMPFDEPSSGSRGRASRREKTSAGDDAPPADGVRHWRDRPRWLRLLVSLSVISAAMAMVASPWWGPRALSRLDFFHVRTVELQGLRYAKAPELVRALAVDTTESVWQPLDSLVAIMEAQPMVLRAVIERDLPGTLRVLVTERVPVALVPTKTGLRPADRTGTVLPIDPAAVPLDLPIASAADSAMLSALDAIRADAPELYARISEVRKAGKHELRFTVTGSTIGASGPAMANTLLVRTNDDVTVARFKDILPVEADLARNHLRAVELDLRFREQVIARQP
jgi:cell division protein FtsQ